MNSAPENSDGAVYLYVNDDLVVIAENRQLTGDSARVSKSVNMGSYSFLPIVFYL